MLDVRCVCCDDEKGEKSLVFMGDTGWRARIGENTMVELLEQNTASANGNSFILCCLFCVECMKILQIIYCSLVMMMTAEIDRSDKSDRLLKDQHSSCVSRVDLLGVRWDRSDVLRPMRWMDERWSGLFYF